MKKTYNINLDKEAVEELKAWLKTKGFSFSGYLNMIVHENLEAIKVLDGVADLSELTLGKAAKLYEGMTKGFVALKEEDENKKREG